MVHGKAQGYVQSEEDEQGAWSLQKWVLRRPSTRQRDNEQLLERIWDAHKGSRRLYGSPRITAEINEQGIRCGKNRVARLMRANGIQAEVRKKFRKKTTDSRHSYALAANLLIERK